ncbi:MAG: transcription-repair coupling factor, partial [Clostridiales bacterium]|nr:transcription-repair coupling factor [Clostridiales bacterium]
QMEENKLENVMVEFINGNLDVLLCTTIIESGLDIPNVNTMIIEDSDKMGLSQLYQIRGRVGRSDKVAYAYITHKHGKVITEDASKRLEAIREFTEFGSGFKIAMRDLEIRGAGNLLGANQHGHMEKVGYDLYVRILNRAVKELSGEIVEEEVTGSCTIELNVNAFIDKKYISNDLMRMEMYKKIAVISDAKQKKLLLDEMTDRFGAPTQEVLILMETALIKNKAAACGVESITRNKSDIVFTFTAGVFPEPETLAEIPFALPGRAVVSMGARPGIRLNNFKREDVDFKAVNKLLDVLSEKKK